ncbi:oxaloacetate decarboxylase [Pseudoflavonifractor sp. 524-17]|nr:oxaloacetate decarboxylase [Pseudoflavonifractor sp. 524-17]
MKKIVGIVLILAGIAAAVSLMPPVGVIGGADGPTAIFAGGRIGGLSAMIGVIIGLVFLAAGIFMIARKNRR